MINLGILGGGQLARMLTMSAHPLGLNVSVLASSAQEPAAQVAGSLKVGSLSDLAVLRQFLAPLNAVTFESEFVDTELLSRALPARCKAFPDLSVMTTIQDRLTQKQLLDQFKIPTSPWMQVSTEADVDKALAKFPNGFVLKQRRFGYDGYGTYKIFKRSDVGADLLAKSPFGFIAEAFITFKRELAIVFVRSSLGTFINLPLVESVQKDARCFSVHGPVHTSRVDGVITSFKRLMSKLDYHGVLAVELFETSRGLLVNELAPRVHNSAHYSLNGLTTSQFEYHLRAGLGLHLPKVQLVQPGFAMVNLLGEGAKDSTPVKLSYTGDGHLHWYGKSENRMGRKLGHINVTDKSAKLALARALKWRKDFTL